MTEPHHWQNQITGGLRGPVLRYLQNQPLSQGDVAMIRAYFRQWAHSDAWLRAEHLNGLRESVDDILTADDITAWLDAAEKRGMNPI